MRRDFWAVFTVAAYALGAGSAAFAQVVAQPETADSGLGRMLYRDNCAVCHGDDLQGQEGWRRPDVNGVLPAPPHDETGHTWHHGDGLLFEYTKFGGAKVLEMRGVSGFSSGMLGFEDAMTDAEIWHVLAYIKSRWPEQMRVVQQGRTADEQLQ